MGKARAPILAVLTLAALALAACSSGSPPSSGFDASPTSGAAPLTVQFTDTSLGEPTAWGWEFGDGGSSSEQSPAHRYTLAGTYDVTLTASTGAGPDSATRAGLIVVAPGPAAELSVESANGPIAAGAQHRFAAQVLDAFGNAVDADVTWSASSAGTVDATGLFTAGRQAGTFADAVIAAVSSGDGLSAAADIVIAPSQPARIEVASLDGSLDIGAELRLEAQVLDEFGNQVEGEAIVWSVEGDANAVTGDGLLTAGPVAGTFEVMVGLGTGDGAVTGVAKFTIAPGPLSRVRIEPASIDVVAGESLALEVVATDADDNPLPDVEVTWRSTLQDIAVAADGTLAAPTSAGAYGPSIEVTAKLGDTTLTAVAPVTVAPGQLTQVVVGPPGIKLGLGMTQQLVAAAGDRFGNRISTPLQWAASDGGSIDADGLFAAGDEAGEFTDAIEVSATVGGVTKSASAKVTVLPDRISFLSDREDDQFDIYVMSADGSDPQRITSTPARKFLYSWSPDGRRLAYDAFALGTGIVLTDDEQAWTVVLVENEPTVGHIYPSWSPDGTKIAFVRLDLEQDLRELYVIDADGGNATRLLNDPDGDAFVPAWSPDGTFIVYDWTPEGERGHIHVIRADGTGDRRLTNHPKNDTSPAWSPNGRRILFASNRDDSDDIYAMDTDGTDVVNLTDTDAEDRSPSWSPDGDRIVFYSDRDENQELYVMDADGTDVQRLTDNESNDIDPRWLPRTAGVAVSAAVLQLSSDTQPVDLTIADVTAAVRSSIVRIETDLGLGSGFIVDADGLVVTNDHVIVDAAEITVRLDDGTELEATVVGRDLIRDIAVLKVEPEAALAPVELGVGVETRLGTLALAIGFPLGTDDLTITQGLVSAVKNDPGRSIVWLQTDAAVNPGNSGGPLVDLQGRVIGIVSAKFVDVSIEGVGFAISAQTVATYLERLKAGDVIGQAP